MPVREKIYLASPLFNEIEREFNRHLRDSLVDDFDVFLPQEDGLLLADLIDNAIDINMAEQLIYDADLNAMKNCNIIVAVLDGATIDEGVSFELGYCHALGKLCLGLQTDIRRQLPSGNNPMIGRSCEKIFSDVSTLISWLEAGRNVVALVL